MLIEYIKNKVEERKTENLNNKILEDLRRYYNGEINSGYICKKWNMENKRIKIDYMLRNLTRKVNIAIKMEEEERVKNMNEITAEYINKIKKEMN